MLKGIVLCGIVLYGIVLNDIVLYCTVLYGIVLYGFVLYVLCYILQPSCVFLQGPQTESHQEADTSGASPAQSVLQDSRQQVPYHSLSWMPALLWFWHLPLAAVFSFVPLVIKQPENQKGASNQCVCMWGGGVMCVYMCSWTCLHTPA